MPSRSFAARRLAAWGIWLLGVALLLEATTRAFFHVTGQDIEVWRHFTITRRAQLLVSDPVLGSRMLPNAARNAFTSDFELVYHTNSLGLRDREPAPTRDYEVLFLGDSQTFGEGVEIGERFSDRVGERLGVATLNAGVPGYGLHQMARWFTLEGWRLKPDLVVCALIEADLGRALYPLEGAGPPQLLKDPHEYDFLPRRLRSSFRRLDEAGKASYLYAFASARLRVALLRRGLAERDRQVWKEIWAHGERSSGMGAQEARAGAPSNAVPPAADGLDPVERKTREVAAGLLVGLKRNVAWSKAELLVVDIDDHPLPWLGQLAQASGIAYLDASGALRGTTGVRYRLDPHYNAKGHDLLAEAISAGIRPSFDLAWRSPGPDAEGEAALRREAAALRAGAPQ